MAPRWLSPRQSAWGTSAERTLPLRFALVGGVVTLFLGAGIGLALGGDGSDGAPAPVVRAPRGPFVIDAAVGAVRLPEQSPEGAVQAATSFITGFPQASLLGPPQQRELLEEALLKQPDPAFARNVELGMKAQRQQLIGLPGAERPLTARLVVSPASYRVDMTAPDRARVQIWNMAVLVEGSVNEVQSSWSTADLQLVWQDHWRVASYRTRNGPTPRLYSDLAAVSSFEEVTTVFNGFQAYRYATAR